MVCHTCKKLGGNLIKGLVRRKETCIWVMYTNFLKWIQNGRHLCSAWSAHSSGIQTIPFWLCQPASFSINLPLIKVGLTKWTVTQMDEIHKLPNICFSQESSCSLYQCWLPDMSVPNPALHYEGLLEWCLVGKAFRHTIEKIVVIKKKKKTNLYVYLAAGCDGVHL